MLRPKEVKSSNFLTGKPSGAGLSARPRHYGALLEKKQVAWLEFLADNYFCQAAPRYEKLEQLAAVYPHVFHCVGFNLGSEDSLSKDYLQKVKSLVERFRPAWVSDHLCFCGHGGRYSPDLLPIPHTEELLERVKKKIETIVHVLGVPFLVENVSAYMKFRESTFTEEEFLARLTEVSGCGILLDVNNLYVNSKNYEYDPYQAFEKLPKDKIWQLHLAGHQNYSTHIVDTHDQNLQAPVLSLFARIAKELGSVPTALERDGNIPPFEEIIEEVNLIGEYYRE